MNNKLPYDDERLLNLIGQQSEVSGGDLTKAIGEDYTRAKYFNPTAQDVSDNPEPEMDASGAIVGKVLNEDSVKGEMLKEALDEQVAKNAMVNSERDPFQPPQLAEVEPTPERIPSSLEQTLNEYQDRKSKLADIQSNVRDRNSQLSMQLGANQIAQAIAAGYGGKIGDGSEAINMLQKNNESKISDYKDQIKDRSDDPNSDISKTYRLVVAKSLKKKYPDLDLTKLDNMSANELEALNKDQSSSSGRVFDKNIIDPVTKQIRSQLYDQSGNLIKDLGEAGYSYGATTDPFTGQTKLISKSDPNATPILQGNPNVKSIDNSLGKEPKKQDPYQIKQMLNPKEKEILDKDVNQFQSEIKEEKRIISEIGALSDSSLELAKKNPNAAKTLGAQIAKIMQGSRLTDSDVVLYTGQSGVLNQMQDFASEALTGTITDEKAKNIKEVLKTYNLAQRNALNNRAKQAAEISKQNFNPDLNIDNDAMAKLYYIDDQNINKKEKTKTPEIKRKTKDGRVAIFDESTKKFIRYED
jgi:hypothetical protein